MWATTAALMHRLHANALQEIGHDCTSWNAAVFYDLMRLGDGTGVEEVSLPCSMSATCCWPQVLALDAHLLALVAAWLRGLLEMLTFFEWSPRRRGRDRCILRHPRLAHDAAVERARRLFEEGALHQGAPHLAALGGFGWYCEPWPMLFAREEHSQ
jgi:hypothetical protein